MISGASASQGPKRPREECLGESALLLIIARQRAYENVRVRGDFHRLPAQPRLAISSISPRDNEGPFRRLKTLNTSEILPALPAAFNSTRPSGSLYTDLAWLHPEVLQQVFAQCDLPFRGDRQRFHDSPHVSLIM